jgi:cyanate permease
MLVGGVGGYILASVVGILIGLKHPFAVHWSGLAVGLAAFLIVSFALGAFSKSPGNG